jgi:hypothetical protein
MPEDANGVPSTRPKPNPLHVASGQAAEDYKTAVRIVMYSRNLPYPEAVKVVEKEKVVNILAKHNAPVAPPESPKAESKPEAKAGPELVKKA